MKVSGVDVDTVPIKPSLGKRGRIIAVEMCDDGSPLHCYSIGEEVEIVHAMKAPVDDADIMEYFCKNRRGVCQTVFEEDIEVLR